MEAILIKALQFFLSLSILIILHELGHFVPAKLFKTRVEKFYLFFDPWFSLFKFKKGETEYGIGWLPLGGYVKIAGMIDESLDTKKLNNEPEPWEFRAKPAWQRLIIMMGGVTVNMLLAIAIYTAMLWSWGESYLPTENMKYGVWCDSLALEAGLMNGDQILKVNDIAIKSFDEITKTIILEDAHTITVNRNKELVNISIPDDLLGKLIKQKEFVFPRFPFHVGGFTQNSVAEKYGLLPEDHIIGINDKQTLYFNEFKSELAYYKNDSATIVVNRNGEVIPLKMLIPESGLIGVYPKSLDNYFEFEIKEYSLIAAIPAGVKKAGSTLSGYIQQFKLLFSPKIKASESLGGFMSIGNMFPSTWDWQIFWGFTAFLSIMLAFLNLLPIPALDGGHVMFLLYEAITRKKPGEKFMEYAQIAGMVLLLSLVVFANVNDVIKFFFN